MWKPRPKLEFTSAEAYELLGRWDWAMLPGRRVSHAMNRFEFEYRSVCGQSRRYELHELLPRNGVLCEQCMVQIAHEAFLRKSFARLDYCTRKQAWRAFRAALID